MMQYRIQRQSVTHFAIISFRVVVLRCPPGELVVSTACRHPCLSLWPWYVDGRVKVVFGWYIVKDIAVATCEGVCLWYQTTDGCWPVTDEFLWTGKSNRLNTRTPSRLTVNVSSFAVTPTVHVRRLFSFLWTRCHLGLCVLHLLTVK